MIKREIARLLKLFKNIGGVIMINDVWILRNDFGIILFVQVTNEYSDSHIFPLYNLNEGVIINFLETRINFNSLPLEELKNKLEEYLIEKI